MAPSEPTAEAQSWLRESDLADADALVREASWNQTAADWRIFIELGKVRAIRNGSGHVIATAATLAYGNRFAWISMVMVAAAHRRRGLATRLLRNCIDDLTAADLVPVLDATPAGREVYRKLGFMDAWSFLRLQRRARQVLEVGSAAGHGIQVFPLADHAWPALCALDAAAFGADRTQLLTRLSGRAPGASFFAERHGRIAGFVLGRDGGIAHQIGPLVADDEAIAHALLTRALAAIEGPVFIDVPDAKENTQKLLAAAGFVSQRGFIRMLLHRGAAFDDGARTFGIVGPEFG
jgi:GNAT superfamily N-acetyltransferase